MLGLFLHICMLDLHLYICMLGLLSIYICMLGLSDENGPKSDELIPTLLRIAQKYNLKVITLFNYYSKKYYLIKKIYTKLVSV